MLRHDHFNKLILLSVFFVNTALADTFIIYYESKSNESPEAHSQHCDRAKDSIIEFINAETNKPSFEDNIVHVAVNEHALSIPLSSYQANSIAINYFIKNASCTDEVDFQSRTSELFTAFPAKENASVYVITPNITNEISATIADLSNSYALQVSVVYVEEPLHGTSLHTDSKVKLIHSKTLSMSEVIRLPQAFSEVSAEPTATENPTAAPASYGSFPIFITTEEALDELEQITNTKYIAPLAQLEEQMNQLEVSLSAFFKNELAPKDSIAKTENAAKALKYLHHELSQLNGSLNSTKETFMHFTDKTKKLIVEFSEQSESIKSKADLNEGDTAFAKGIDESISNIEDKLFNTERLLVNTGRRLTDATNQYGNLYVSFLNSVKLSTTDDNNLKESLNEELGLIGFNIISYRTLLFLGEDLNPNTIENLPTIKPDYEKISSKSLLNELTTVTKNNTLEQTIALNGIVKSGGGDFILLFENGSFAKVSKETFNKTVDLQGYAWKKYANGYIIFSSTLNELYFISDSTVLDIKERLSAGERAQSAAKVIGNAVKLIVAGAGAAFLDIVTFPQNIGLHGKEAEFKFPLTQRNYDLIKPQIVSELEKAAGFKDFIQTPDKVFPAIVDITAQKPQ